MKSLKQIYREHGYEVNRDDQKGIGNKCLEDVQKCFKDLLDEYYNDVRELSGDPDVKGWFYMVINEIKALILDCENAGEKKT
jgi:hypothetical protein